MIETVRWRDGIVRMLDQTLLPAKEVYLELDDAARVHEAIRALIEELDGSGREFHVIPLRRLEADYVAGTIMFMMAGKEEKQQSGYSRTYIDVYGSYSGRGDKEKKPDEFRVDADVEYNRLLL